MSKMLNSDDILTLCRRVKMIVALLLQKFPTLFVSQGFVTMFARTR